MATVFSGILEMKVKFKMEVFLQYGSHIYICIYIFICVRQFFNHSSLCHNTSISLFPHSKLISVSLHVANLSYGLSGHNRQLKLAPVSCYGFFFFFAMISSILVWYLSLSRT